MLPSSLFSFRSPPHSDLSGIAVRLPRRCFGTRGNSNHFGTLNRIITIHSHYRYNCHDLATDDTTSSSSPWKVAVVIPRSPTLPSSKAVRMVWMVAVELLLVQERLLGEQGSHFPRP